jgi:hypothetical protein
VRERVVHGGRGGRVGDDTLDPRVQDGAQQACHVDGSGTGTAIKLVEAANAI